MSWVSKSWKKMKKYVNRAMGTMILPATLAVGMIKNGGDINKAADDAYNFFSKGSDKPQTEEAPDVTGGLAAAVEEEESKRKKKRGFAANVLTDEFRFGGGL